MACNGDYMNPTGLEKNLSTVYGLLDELNSGVLRNDYNDGYDKRVYNQKLTLEDLNNKVKELCSKLQNVDVTKYSLEMQIWWRDHQIADKKRLEMEMENIKIEKEKQEAISKLTPYERELLGL